MHYVTKTAVFKLRMIKLILLTILLHLLWLSNGVNSTHKDIFNNNDTGDYPTQWHKKREGLVVSGPESGGCKSKLEWFKCGNGNVEDQCKNSHQPKTHFYLTSGCWCQCCKGVKCGPHEDGSF